MEGEVTMYDVIVIGGGMSGVMAAVGAAREQRRVLLVERGFMLGGMATAGLVQPITCWGVNIDDRTEYVIGGTGRKFLEMLHGKNPDLIGSMTTYGPVCDTEYLKLELERLIAVHEVELFYGSSLVSAEVDQGRIQSIQCCSNQGIRRLSAGMFIDASGDCALAAAADADCFVERQGISLMFILSGIDKKILFASDYGDIWRKHRGDNYREAAIFNHPRQHTVYLNMTEVDNADGLGPAALAKTTCECREQAWEILRIFKEYVPGCSHAYIEQTAPALGVRESRRIKGTYYLTGEDAITGRDFPDVIARCGCPIDIHGTQLSYSGLKKSFAIPYRSLVPGKVKNLLVTGRGISADHTAHSSLRRMAPGMALGEAAGIAAALAEENDKLEVAKLQAKLEFHGAILAD